jgi:hypothetical protein
VRLVTADGRALPLKSVELESEAGGGVARSTLRQRFRNIEAVPLEVTYLVPLPADGVVSGYRFELAGVVTLGVVEKTQLAREHYEEALMQGPARSRRLITPPLAPTRRPLVDEDALIEQLLSAHRESGAHGAIHFAPAFFDLSPEARETAFATLQLQRALEAGSDSEGLSTTARAILGRITG